MDGELVWNLIVGLGNPGPRYEQNRHNVGFRCLDALAGTYGLVFTGVRARARIARGVILGHPVVLAKPMTFVNESGQAVRGLMARHSYGPQDLLVVHDDLDLPRERLRFQPGGRAAGHKGVQSIIDALGTQEFARLRVGIGRPPVGQEVVDYVLSDFGAEEQAAMAPVYQEAASAIGVFLTLGIEEAMNKYN